MSVAPIGNIPYCKGLWSVISGTICRCDKDLVEDEIKNATPLLRDGLNFFKKFTEESLQDVSKNNPPPRMYDLISKLAPLLNVDATITWDLVCNFMIYEYRNCAETFASQLTDLTSMKVLIEEIWSFYYAERITLIKCLKLMVEYRDNVKHPHQKEFCSFFDEVLLGSLLESVQKQIEALKFINPPSRSQLFTEDHLHWIYESSLNEMRELLHIYTVILNDVHVADSAFSNIYASISGEPRRLISYKSHEDRELVAKKIEVIQYSQAGLLLVAFDVAKHVGMEDWIKGVGKTMQDTLEHKCLRDSLPQDGPLLLAWMLANYAIEPENPDVLNCFRPFGIRAIQMNVFHYLRGLLDSEMIREDTHYAEIVRSSLYNLLTLLCAFIDEDRLDTLTGVFDAVAAVLRYPELAERFWQEREEGLWVFYKYAAQWFPYRFEPLTAIVTGLASASASSAKNVTQELDNLPSLTLEVSRQTLHTMDCLKPYEQDCIIHRNSFRISRNTPHERIDSARRRNDGDEFDVVLWQTKASYWDAFHHKIEQLFLQASGGMASLSYTEALLPEQVSQGFALLEALLATDMEIPRSMVIPTELSFEIVNRFSYASLSLNIYKVVAACIRVSSKLVLRYPEDVLSRMRTEVYPRFDDRYQKTTEFAEAVSFDGGLIASWLSSIETIQHTYPILNAYLDTLSNYLIARHSKEAMYSVEIPGMVLLLQSILPKLDSWYFQSESEKVELWLKSIFCLHRALDSVPEHKGESRNELKLIVTYNLLHLEPRHALLKMVRTGERALRNRMMNETDWIAGKGFKVIKSVQLALSVVNRLLMYRKNLGLGIEERSPLEIALYASPSLPNGLLIVPTIVDYLYVWFSPALQAMAVRLLKKFAEGFSMSLLVCMGMDGTAIRETFASRLMSPTCAAEVKVAVLELVAVCLDRQPGLTEALFNIMHQAERKRIFPRPADEFLTEGCTQFLDLYMQRIFQEDNIVYDRLYDSTMSLLRAIWYHRNEILVNFFRKKPEFWSHLFAPLFRKLVPNVKGYSQLIDIITLELFKSTLLEKDFETNLDKLLDAKEDYWGKMTNYVFKSVPNSELAEEEDQVILEKDGMKPFYESMLESWYQLLVTITDERVAKKYPIDEKQARETTSLALDHLLELLKQPTPKSSARRISIAKTTMLLASIALRCISSWKLKCISNSSDLKNKLRQLVHEIAQFYRGYGRSLRQTLISLVLGCMQLIGEILVDDNVTLDYLLGQSCLLAIGDVEELRELARSRERKRKFVNEDGKDKVDRASEDLEAMELAAISESLPATLTVSVITQLLNYQIEYNSKNRRRKSASLQLGQLISEIMTTVGVTMQKHPYAKFSKVALALLGTAVRSISGSFKFEEEAVAKLWLTLIPPPDLKNSVLDSLYDDCSSMSIWRCQDWWPLYTIGIEFIIGLVISESSSAYISFVVTFLGSHEYQLMEVSTLLRHTADPAAADLIQSLISLVSTLSTKPVYWDSIQPSVRETLVKCTYLAYDSTVNLLLRPRILKFIMDGISVESAEELQTCDEKQLSGELKLLVNKLILINTSCAMSFVYFSPRLNTLVDTIYCQEDFWYAPMAEMNFGPPQMCITSGPQLTYGTIISATQLFTQAQLHAHSSKSPSSTLSTLSNTVIRPSTSRDEKIDSAKKEWERASPENLRRMQVKDLRKILHHTGSSASVVPSLLSNLSSGIDFSGFLTGQDVTVSLLSNPRLIRRPFDPLICENTILSRATALIPISSRSHVGKGSTSSPRNEQDALNRSRGEASGGTSDPWFASMEENNTRLALEVNLALILCQALEGVKSPRLALRDRQLIARETATEIGVFFDFLEQKNFTDWQVSATLIEADSKKSRVVEAPDVFNQKLSARLVKNSTIQKTAVNSPSIEWDSSQDNTISVFEDADEPEERSNEDVVTSGGFGTKIVTMKFLPLLGNLLKSVIESLDSSNY
ncbi:nucleoporin Nup188 [Leptopilina heterotoma]|uniref:nucleoporin Nup188 n=1 Tax=Leptopilina heterotoma TaxID=63436 RepID=UPI001CA980A8|nr:nucleoporin Nup188 [Leptopilina heterotoma]